MTETWQCNIRKLIMDNKYCFYNVHCPSLPSELIASNKKVGNLGKSRKPSEGILFTTMYKPEIPENRDIRKQPSSFLDQIICCLFIKKNISLILCRVQLHINLAQFLGYKIVLMSLATDNNIIKNEWNLKTFDRCEFKRHFGLNSAEYK